MLESKSINTNFVLVFRVMAVKTEISIKEKLVNFRKTVYDKLYLEYKSHFEYWAEHCKKQGREFTEEDEVRFINKIIDNRYSKKVFSLAKDLASRLDTDSTQKDLIGSICDIIQAEEKWFVYPKPAKWKRDEEGPSIETVFNKEYELKTGIDCRVNTNPAGFASLVTNFTLITKTLYDIKLTKQIIGRYCEIIRKMNYKRLEGNK